MQQDFRVESYSYDQMLRGSWRAFRLDATLQLGDEQVGAADGSLRLWLPSGTLMHWSSGTRPLRSNCLQFYWPERWYMFSAFYNGDVLIHTYATIIRPATMMLDHISYIDLDLSMLVKPDLSYEVLTQAEFEHMSEVLHYDEETRMSASQALRSLSSSIQRSIGIFTSVPNRLDLSRFRLVGCGDN